jgi:glycosyltransferase involved in cell wall biosynthesis
MRFSILIATLVERQTQFQRLCGKLSRQVGDNRLEKQIEVLHLVDRGEQSIGAKRNALIERARGDFVAFVDDDDDVADDYVARIHQALCTHPAVDCVGITGVVRFRGAHPHRFVHSRQYDHYYSRGGIYYRPPYILNPVRREIAQQFPFENANSGEDIDWAMRMARARVLRREFMVDAEIYSYFSRRPWLAQWLIDATEAVRHPLGLQSANRFRLARWLKTWRRR